MSLTPRNWTEFQQYKDRKPDWIKLHRNLLDNYDFARLPVESRALAPMLWLLASEYENGEIGATTEEIAFRLRMPHDDLCRALGPLVESKFFLVSNNLVIHTEDRIKLYESVQERTETYLEKEREIEKQVKKEKDNAHSRDENFEKFWSSYPKRASASPKKPARLKFDAAVKRGVDPEKITAGARAYASEQERLGNAGTQYVKTPEVWLGQEGWTAFDAEQKQGPPPGLDPIARRDWIRAQMEAESAKTDASGNSSGGTVLEGGDGLRPQDQRRPEEPKLVRSDARNADKTGGLGKLLYAAPGVHSGRA